MPSERASIILVVDDNAATLYSTSRVLRNAGYHVVEATNGTEALARAAEAPDLVILDVNLPDIDGLEVCRRLREMPQTARIPLIHLSATFVNDDHRVLGLEAGADGYITQPVEPPVLVATVKAFLRARQAEDPLRMSEARFKAVFEQAMHGIALLTDGLVFLEVNPAVCRMLGVRREELIGRQVSAFTPSAHTNDVAEIETALREQRSWRGTMPLLDASASRRDLEWSVSTHSEPGLLLALMTDVTDRVRMETDRERLLASEQASRAAAERANQLKDDFLAMLSHELRTPLNAIVGWGMVLRQRTDLTDPDLVRGLEAIERNARVQTRLIADLLDVSRITAGKLTLESDWFDPAEAIDNALASVRPLAHARQVTVIVEVDRSSTTPLSWDLSRFQQVVWNLADNAVKFTPAGGRVRVRLSADDDWMELSVSDTGRGISPDFLPHVFERFRQEDSPLRRGQGGLGLGLAIVKHLVESQGGSISATSDGEGLGATFTAKFRRRPKPTFTAADVTIVDETVPSLHGVRALVVEDDEDARILVSRTLSDAGASVCDVSDAQSAIEALEKFGPDMLVSDIGMPQSDGYDLIRRVRALGYTAERCPAIALTAFAREEDGLRALSAGYQVHLAKPVYPQHLVSVASRILQDARKARMENV